MQPVIFTLLIMGLVQNSLGVSEAESGSVSYGEAGSSLAVKKAAGQYYICKKRSVIKKFNDNSSEAHNQSEPLGKNIEIAKGNILEKITVEDWEAIVNIIKTTLKEEEDRYVLDLANFKELFDTLSEKYIDLKFIDFSIDVSDSIKKSKFYKKNKYIYWEDSSNANLLPNSEYKDDLDGLEKPKNIFLDELNPTKQELVADFGRIQEFIKSNPQDSVTFELSDYFSLDLKNEELIDGFKNFTKSLVLDLGSTALPLYDLYGSVKTIAEDFLFGTNFLSRDNKKYDDYENDIGIHFRNIIANPNVKDASFKRFENKYGFNQETLTKLKNGIDKMIEDRKDSIQNRLTPSKSESLETDEDEPGLGFKENQEDIDEQSSPKDDRI